VHGIPGYHLHVPSGPAAWHRCWSGVPAPTAQAELGAPPDGETEEEEGIASSLVRHHGSRGRAWGEDELGMPTGSGGLYAYPQRAVDTETGSVDTCRKVTL